MSFMGWVATHTGLPSFYATGTGKITADHPILGPDMPRLVKTVSGEALVSDPGATAGIATTYRFGSSVVTLQRVGKSSQNGDTDHQMITDTDGNTVAGVRMMGSDDRSYDVGSEIFVSALGRPIPRYRLGTLPPTGSLEFVTDTAGTDTLRKLVATRSPLWVVHNVAACFVEDCDIEGTRLVVPSRIKEVRSPRRDVAQRGWTVDYTLVPGSLALDNDQKESASQVVTWGQWETWSKTNSPKGWQEWSALTVAHYVAGMPSM